VLAEMAAGIAGHPACYPDIVATSSAKNTGIAELRGDIFYFTCNF